MAEKALGRYASIANMAAGIIGDVAARGKNPAPLQYVMGKALQKAAESLIALVDADAEDPKAIRALQNDVKMFRQMIETCRESILLGMEADAKIDEETRQSLTDMLDPGEQGAFDE
jgi:hypothetical protein